MAHPMTPREEIPPLSDRDALRFMAQAGDVLEAGGRRWFLCPFPDALDDHLSALDADREDMEDDDPRGGNVEDEGEPEGGI